MTENNRNTLRTFTDFHLKAGPALGSILEVITVRDLEVDCFDVYYESQTSRVFACDQLRGCVVR